MPAGTEWLFLSEIAAQHSIPLQTIYNLRARGEFAPAFKIGSRVRVRRSDLDEWLASKAEQPRGAA